MNRKNPLKRLYNWVLHWAETPYGAYALFAVAISESSFFPIPPDVLLIALSISKPKKSYYYALLCTIGSVLGGILGYYIGYGLMEAIGIKILTFYGAMEQFEKIAYYYQQYDALAVGAAGFTPIPYKVFTIAAGACRISFPVFIIASIISRGTRFFIQAILLSIFGEKIKKFIDKYFNLLSLLFFVLLILGFVVVKLVIQK
ncbi:DedA family protein [bacterium]|nr:DedA family protein [bacterium]